MKIRFAWIVDPTTKKPSVSLTNFVVSVVFLLTAASLNLADVVKDTSIAVEYLGISAALYFGRKFNFKGQSYEAEQPEAPPTQPTP